MLPTKDQLEGSKTPDAAPTSSLTANIPSRSGLGDTTHDEVVSRFIASCPGGSLESMAKIPSKILTAKGTSVLAEVELNLHSC